MPPDVTCSTGSRRLLPPFLLLLTFLAQGAWGEGWLMLEQPFRLDEINTVTLVTDPDLGHAMHALAEGADYNPPMLYLLLRAFTAPWQADETSLRLFSLLCVLGGLLGIYGTLRRGLSPLVCAVTVLALWDRPILLRQAFDARFYAPWFAALAWFAFFLSRPADRPGSDRPGSDRRAPTLGLALTAALTCTLHYFGVLSLVLVVAAHAVFRQPLGAARWAGIACGPLALLACLPFYRGQQAALTVSTWIQPRDLISLVDYARELVPSRHLALVVIAVLVAAALRRGSPRPAAGAHAGIGLVGLVVMPLVLLAFSWLVQQAMVVRYGLVTIAGFAPVIGGLLHRLPRAAVLVLGAYFAVTGTVTFDQVVDDARHKYHSKERLIAEIRQHADGAVVVFEARQDMVPVLHYAPELAAQCAFLDFEQEQIPDASALRLCGRDVARRYAMLYPAFRILPLEQVLQLERFYLVSWSAEPGPEYAAFTTERIDTRLYALRRR